MSSNGLVAVHIYGPLADRFGERHEFAISTPAEAVMALDANYPGFLAAFNEAECYHIHADGDWRPGESGTFPVSRELHMCPVIEGRAFIGPAIVGWALGIGAATLTAQILGTALMIGLLLGVSMLLSPSLKKKDEDTKKDESYAFSGPENVTGQGVAVPLIYGRVYAGSVVISAGLELSTEIAPTSHPTSSTFASRAAPVPSTAVEPGLDPPPGGWPPIVEGEWGPQPEGWAYTTRLSVTDDAGVMQFVMIFCPDPQPDAVTVYAWNEKQGYYGLVKVMPVAEDWMDGIEA